MGQKDVPVLIQWSLTTDGQSSKTSGYTNRSQWTPVCGASATVSCKYKSQFNHIGQF